MYSTTADISLTMATFSVKKGKVGIYSVFFALNLLGMTNNITGNYLWIDNL